ncbi:MAG: Hsp70 family protein [Planctomycetes bacterium]|nr:Hsp70 family protein [Planctomycetota bacterium]
MADSEGRSRFVVGIDLGTTNCALAYADAREDPPRIRTFPVPQITRGGAVLDRPVLPSFIYLAPEGERPRGDLPAYLREPSIAGEFARDRGWEVPFRLVSSAKSWLCHGGVDRTSPILPWGAPDEVPHLSPVEASAAYIRHLRGAWDDRIARGDPALVLDAQEIVLTVPASFDAVARDLTVRAAESAGLRVTLIEEPTAAFYAWLDATGDAWRERVRVGDRVLVCDVGGGTTDFTLVAVGDDAGSLALERVAVGSHLLVGGDNMDLALALAVRDRLAAEGRRLDAWQLRALWFAARGAKEAILADPTRSSHEISILGRGRGVVAGTIATALERGTVERTVLEGFFPQVGWDAVPELRRRAGLQEVGLPYEADPAVTRHMAAFLREHRAVAGAGEPFAAPTALLLNGGVLKSAALRDRLADVLDGWLTDTGLGSARRLEGTDVDLAVARGAAYYGLVRRGKGVRVRGGSPRSYYIGVESALPSVPGMAPPLKAVCLVPFGMEEGQEVEVPGQEFSLAVGRPAEFRFLSSSIRKDAPGETIEDWEGEIEEVAPLETVLEGGAGDAGRSVRVRLHARLSEVGTLELACVAPDGRRWKLEFNTRERERSR